MPAALPEPETAYVLGDGASRIVTLAWRAGEGEPVLPGTDLSLAVMAVPGDTDEAFLTQAAGTRDDDRARGRGRRPRLVDRRGAPRPPRPAIRRHGGVLTSRLAGDTLVFARDGTLYRLESALGRDATLEVAASLR